MHWALPTITGLIKTLPQCQAHSTETMLWGGGVTEEWGRPRQEAADGPLGAQTPVQGPDLPQSTQGCWRQRRMGGIHRLPVCFVSPGLLTAATDGPSLVPPLLAAAAVYHLPGARGQPLCPHPRGLVSLQQDLASLCSAPPGPGGLALLPAGMMPNSWKDVSGLSRWNGFPLSGGVLTEMHLSANLLIVN